MIHEFHFKGMINKIGSNGSSNLVHYSPDEKLVTFET